MSGYKNKEKNRGYMREYMKERWRARRVRAIGLLGGKCAKCATILDLEFDHVEPKTKIGTIAKLSSVSEKRFLAELNKCQLLCPIHHKEKTLLDLGFTPSKGVHGKLVNYRHCGCRCDVCRKVHNDYTRNWKRKRITSFNGEAPDS